MSNEDEYYTDGISDDSLYEEEEQEAPKTEQQEDLESQQEGQDIDSETQSELPTVSTDVKPGDETEEDKEANELYAEFKEFLVDKQDIQEDSGEKPVVPTGIDLLDAILGGGFGIGCMSILTGNPGCGKCLDYEEEIDVYIDGKEVRVKIGELYDNYVVNGKLEDVSETTKDIYVESESGELVKLNGLVKKDITKIYRLILDDDSKFDCAGKHLLKNSDDQFVYVENLNVGDQLKSTYGTYQVIDKYLLKGDYVYDISMESEHVYTTPNGLVHHNSMLAAQTLGNAQRLNKGKLLAGFLDAEQSMTTKRLFNLGVKRPKVKPYSDMTVEKVFKYVEALCMFKEQKKMKDIPSIVIWDSIANTLTEKEKETDDVNQTIGQKARLLSKLIPSYLEKCSKYNICLLAVNQLRESVQIGAFPQAPDLKFLPNKDMPGGQALKFNAFQLLHMQIKSEISTAKGHKFPFDGLVVRTKCVKNKLFTPNIDVELISTYAGGFSNFWTNYHFLTNTKRLKAGSWNSLVRLPEKKWRTKDAPKMYEEDSEFREAFDESVKEAIQYDIIDRYGD